MAQQVIVYSEKKLQEEENIKMDYFERYEAIQESDLFLWEN